MFPKKEEEKEITFKDVLEFNSLFFKKVVQVVKIKTFEFIQKKLKGE